MNEKTSKNGKQRFIINATVDDERGELIGEDALKRLDYLFKESDLSDDDELKELGKDFPEHE